MNSDRELLADGDITKMVIRPSEKPAIVWERGMNAKFHYTVHAYVPSSVINHHTHDNSHESCCSKKKKIQNIMEMIEKAKGGKVNESPEVSQPVRQFIADSRQHDSENPFELRIGYSFSVKAMEFCVKSMKVGEKSRFLCQNEYANGYAQLEMSLRKEKQNKINLEKGLPMVSDHICSAHANSEFMTSLTDLQKIDGYPLEYEIELLTVQERGEYLLEPWEMTVPERFEEAVTLKTEGNGLYKTSDLKKALEKYTRALIMVESLSNSPEVADAKRDLKLQNDEKQRQDWLKTQNKTGHERDQEAKEFRSNISSKGLSFTMDELETLDISLRLNFSACQLRLGEYQKVIIQCSEILNRDPYNLKALFRRSEAYIHIGRDLDFATNDMNSFRTILDKLDKCRKRSEWADLSRIEKMIQEKLVFHQEKEKQLYSGIFKS